MDIDKTHGKEIALLMNGDEQRHVLFQPRGGSSRILVKSSQVKYF